MVREYCLYETIDQVPLNEWNEVCQASPSCFMDPAFLRAIEKTLPDQARVFHVLIYEEDGKPVPVPACACIRSTCSCSPASESGTGLAGSGNSFRDWARQRSSCAACHSRQDRTT